MTWHEHGEEPRATMNRHAEEEEAREINYAHLRRLGFTVDEAAECSLAYIKRLLGAEVSLTTTAYLEQQYQDSIPHSHHSSTPSPYGGDLPRRSRNSGDSRNKSRHGNPREYSPSPYDYQSNARGRQGEPHGYSHSKDRSAPPPQPTYAPRTYTTEERRPYSTYRYYASKSTYSTYTNTSRYRTPPAYRYVRPSSPLRPVSPPPEGTKPTIDLYTVLGVSRNATADEIKKAHRALSLRWHPDRCVVMQDKQKATEKMAEINQANDVLRDEVKRRFYDQWGVLPPADE